MFDSAADWTRRVTLTWMRATDPMDEPSRAQFLSSVILAVPLGADGALVATSDPDCPTAAWLHGYRSERRGPVMGLQLFKLFLGFLRMLGVERVCVFTERAPKAGRIYRRLGFEEVEPHLWIGVLA